MSSGRSWLVQTDPSKMLDGNLGRDHESDVLIPQSVAAAVSAKKRSSAGSAAIASGTKAGPADTIDVVLGFTNGLVTKYGSVANANSRLTNLIAITNQAYQNSLVTPRVRLVRTVQVSYTDTNDNETALEALTGFNCTTTGCTAQTVPTELVPLRTARDQYGGDLVSLVRPFQAPQHQGCGIAWLLGGGGFTIDNTDAPFGYSIVSDGTDVDEGDGRTYFCREETLAHELGHNMGQQHNVEDAGTPPDTGTHPYSYGYRETTTTGFYTVMAYRLANSSQFSINFFGNPGVNYLDTGRPTGTASADNARSLNLAMPLVAQFRASVVPFGGKVRNDVNADGLSDVLQFNSVTAELRYWRMDSSGNVASTTGGFFLPFAYTPRVTGDFNGNGFVDIVLSNDTSVRIFSFNATGVTDQLVAPYPSGYQLSGAGDIDADGNDDLVWFNPLTRDLQYWLMNGTAIKSVRGGFGITNGYKLKAVGDVTGDGRADIVFTDPSRSVWVFVTNSSGGLARTFVATLSGTMNLVGADDINGDGTQDLIGHSRLTGAFEYWVMTQGARSAVISGFNFANQSLRATGDYNGDGRADILWSNGNVRRTTFSPFNDALIGSLGVGWNIIPVAGQSALGNIENLAPDTNNDGTTDLLLFNQTTRELQFSVFDEGRPVSNIGGYGIASGYTARTTADFNGDGRADIIWSNGTNVRLFASSGATGVTDGFVASHPAGWDVVGSGDVNLDGRADLIWFNPTTRVFMNWIMNGASVSQVQSNVLTAPTGYTPRAVGNFGQTFGIALSNGSNVRVASYSATASTYTLSGVLNTLESGFEVFGAGDTDGDGRTDIFMYNTSTNELAWWLMSNDTAVFKLRGYVLSAGSVPKAVGDFNGDGRADVLWNQTSGAGAGGLRLFTATPWGGFSNNLIGTLNSGWDIIKR